MKMKAKKKHYDLVSRNPNNWRGVFYYNPLDPRICVHKQNPMRGWTLNFACPYTYCLIAALISILSLSVYLGL